MRRCVDGLASVSQLDRIITSASETILDRHKTGPSSMMGFEF